MAKIKRPVLGRLSGKIGNIVIRNWRGIQVVSMVPDKWERDSSIRSLNVKGVFSFLGWLYVRKLRWLIGGYWEELCKRKKLTMTGQNLFTKYNFGIYWTIPERDKLLGEGNFPNFSEISIAEGSLFEPTIIKRAGYKDEVVRVEWDSKVYKEGGPEDRAWVVILYCSPSPKLLGTAKVLVAEELWKRKDGGASISIDGVDTRWLYLYLFFTNDKGCSRSAGLRLDGSAKYPIIS